ncbi:hypothetical protein PG984_000164 [Apiospora sp. TS-2023a]
MRAFEHILGSEEDTVKVKHVEVLLKFLRPKYERQFIAASNRLSSSQPTVRFEDMWILMKPGSLAYTNWDGQWIGCVIGKSTKLPPKPVHGYPQCWSIEYWFLQVHWPSDQIRFAINSVVINKFEGEQLVTSLPLYPADLHDAEDNGERKRHLTERGQRTHEILLDDSRYMSYEGECLTRSKQHISGDIIVGGADEAEELTSTHCWRFPWVPPNEIFQPSDPLGAIELLINAENTRSLDLPTEITVPAIGKNKLKAINAMVDCTNRGNALRPSKTSGTRGAGTVVLLHGPPGVGKSYTVEYISMKARRPLILLSGLQLNTSRESMEQTLKKWFSLGEKWNAIFHIDNCDEIFMSAKARHEGRGAPQQTFTRALEQFNGLLFLTTTRIGLIDEYVFSFANLMIRFEKLENRARLEIWRGLEKRFRTHDSKVVLSPNITTFLTRSVRMIDLNGHEMSHCFKVAIALAASMPKHPGSNEGDKIIVDDEHFKEAINMAHESRQYMSSIHGGDESTRASSLAYRNDKFEYSDGPSTGVQGEPRRPQDVAWEDILASRRPDMPPSAHFLPPGPPPPPPYLNRQLPTPKAVKKYEQSRIRNADLNHLNRPEVSYSSWRESQ